MTGSLNNNPTLVAKFASWIPGEQFLCMAEPCWGISRHGAGRLTQPSGSFTTCLCFVNRRPSHQKKWWPHVLSSFRNMAGNHDDKEGLWEEESQPGVLFCHCFYSLAKRFIIKQYSWKHQVNASCRQLSGGEEILWLKETLQISPEINQLRKGADFKVTDVFFFSLNLYGTLLISCDYLM